MGTDNKSLSYLRDRKIARKWLSDTKPGQYAVELMKKDMGNANLAAILTDDKWVQWEDLIAEHKDSLAIAANCAEARKAADLARKSSSRMGPAMPTQAKWLRFFSPPISYVLRRQVETMDPDYWNDPKNVLREALDNDQWATVSADTIRGEIDRMIPGKKKKVVLASHA